MSFEAPAPPAVQRMSTGKKVAIGCAGTAVLFGVGVLALLCGGMYWVVSPGRQVPTAVVIGPESAGVMRADDIATDPGTRALLLRFLQAAENAGRQKRADLPPLLRRMQEWNQANASRSLAQWIPREITISYEPDPRHGLHAVTALNFPMYVRPMRAFVERLLASERAVRKTEHGGHTILTLPDGTSMCFVDATFVFGGGPEQIRAVIDRAARAGDTVPLPAAVTSVPGEWDLRAALARPETAVEVAVLLLATSGVDPQAATGVTAARYGLDAVTADRSRAWLELTYPDADAAREALPVWENAVQGLADNTRPWGLRLEGSPRVEETQLVITVQIDGVETALDRWMAQSMKQAPDEQPGE